jgi:hypothetical protein
MAVTGGKDIHDLFMLFTVVPSVGRYRRTYCSHHLPSFQQLSFRSVHSSLVYSGHQKYSHCSIATAYSRRLIFERQLEMCLNPMAIKTAHALHGLAPVVTSLTRKHLGKLYCASENKCTAMVEATENELSRRMKTSRLLVSAAKQRCSSVRRPGKDRNTLKHTRSGH